MCGIAGIVGQRNAPPVDPRVLEAMTHSMEHRGPDGWGTWLSEDRRVGLGHRRLAILDLSDAGRQPMSNPEGTICVTFNGEIYNFPELRRELSAMGYRFRSTTDTEVLVYLYDALGEAMIDRLDGDFGFGLWDDRRKRLLLARDRAGVKPVYYAQLGDRFVFASEIKALLHCPGLACELNEESLYHYLTYLVVPAPQTMFKGIHKLPAGCALTVEWTADGLRTTQRNYWAPTPGRCALRTGELDEQFQELFDRSVRKRLQSDVPVGVLFSGGVDSTLNAAYFQRGIAPQKVRTFNVGVAGTKLFHDESDFAQAMARELGTEHHVVRITQADLLRQMRAIARQQDEPLADPVCVPLYFVTKLARETGTFVVHAGEGADEIFCGYDKYRRYLQVYENVWRRLRLMPSWTHALAFHLLRAGRSSRVRKAADVLRRLGRSQNFFLSSSIAYYEHEKASVLAPEFRRRCAGLDSHDIVLEMYGDLKRACPEADFLQQLTYIELRLRLPELLLMRVDKMSMLNGVEVRVPFLDGDLVDFALSVPRGFKLRDGVLKEPLKRLAARHVPRSSVYRPKSGFGVPIQEWFRSELAQDMRDLLREDAASFQAYFDLKALRRKLDEGTPTVNDAFQLWVVYNFLQWRRSFWESRPRQAA